MSSSRTLNYLMNVGMVMINNGTTYNGPHFASATSVSHYSSSKGSNEMTSMSKRSSSTSSNTQIHGASSIFFSNVSAIWKCRNDHIFKNVRASQTKAKVYLSELLSFSLSQIAKPFSDRPL